MAKHRGIEFITVREFVAGAAKGRDVYIATHAGAYRVSHIRWPETDPWAVTPEANGGFGSSWCVHYGTPLYFSAADAQLVYDAERVEMARLTTKEAR